LESASENRLKGDVALMDSLFHASGFAGDRWPWWSGQQQEHARQDGNDSNDNVEFNQSDMEISDSRFDVS